jgi:multidrug efflux pump subunit AcrA (membrane-fusion protein)
MPNGVALPGSACSCPSRNRRCRPDGLNRRLMSSILSGCGPGELHPLRQLRNQGARCVANGCLLALVVVGLLTGCRHDAKDAGAEDEAKPVVKVEVRPIVRTALDETVEVLGTTQPLKRLTARVTTAMEGRVAAILPSDVGDADSSGAPPPEGGTPTSPATEFPPKPQRPSVKPAVEGQMVDRQQVIVRLDDSLARAAVAKAQGALAEAQATLAAQSAPGPQQLQAAEAALASAKSAREAAEAQLKRLKDVEQLVGASQVADAQTAMERARADEHTAAARLAEQGKLPAARKSAELQAKVKAAEADLTAAEIQLELTHVRSPIVGRLGQVSVYLGQSLPAGSPVATVTDLRQIEVQASVPAKHIRRVQVGQSATIVWGDESAPESLPGKVTFVAQEIEAGSGSFPVVIVADNPDERLRSGLHIQARIVVHHVDNALAVPQSAVIEETDEPFIFVAVKADDAKEEKEAEPAGQGKDGKQTEKTDSKEGGKDPLVARKVPVKVLARSGDLLQIEQSGGQKRDNALVKEGALVVTDRNYFLADKMPVEIESGDPKEEAEKK